MISVLTRRIATFPRTFSATVPTFTRTFTTTKVTVGQKRYTKEHEYVLLTSKTTAKIGISNHAQEALGDVVYVDLPSEGTHFAKGEVFGSVESVKAASNIYAPVDLTITKVNSVLRDDSGLINRSAEGDGWMIEATIANTQQIENLLDESEYKKHCESEAH